MSEQVKVDEIKENVKDSNVWKRLLFMVLFAVLYYAAQVILVVVVLYQFLTLLITGEKNAKVLSFGAQISTYVYQVFSFLSFNSEEKPFPLGDWPSDKPLAEKATQASKPKRTPRKPAAKKPAAKKVAPKAVGKQADETAADNTPTDATQAKDDANKS